MLWSLLVRLPAVLVVAAAVLTAHDSAWATAAVLAQQAPASLDQVISNLRVWLIGLLVGLATLFLTVGGIRYLAADGDPGQIEQARRSLRNSAIGYALAVLAPVFVSVLQSLVG